MKTVKKQFNMCVRILIADDHEAMRRELFTLIQKQSDMEVIGEIPKDIDGVYVRNTENQVHEPIGRYHPFGRFKFVVIGPPTLIQWADLSRFTTHLTIRKS